jgi:hypothetical protein
LGRSYLSNHSQALYVGAIELFLSSLLCALLFEGLVVAALPLLSYHIERRPWLEVAALGVIVGGWIAVAALIAWLILGH